MKRDIVIGSRGSKLALWQSYEVKDQIESLFPHISVAVKIIQTKGDKILDVSLSKIGDKSLFTKEIEHELLDSSVDIAVHSLKDLPTVLPQGLIIGAVLPRAEYRDVLLARAHTSLSELTENNVVGTSSLRRRAGLLAYNPKLKVIDIRGNIDTRIQKMEAGYCDAIIMAAAGVHRLGLHDKITEIIDENIIVPAVSQGIIAVECRENDAGLQSLLQSLNHAQTSVSSVAERSFLHAMKGGCQLPLGCISTIDNQTISMHASIATIDGKESIEFSLSGSVSNPKDLGEKLAQKFFDAGAQKILDTII
ncbi:MAG: hydroxymethylbilane synthase [Bacteroidales bacterium]|jgi:hydroxymethylbilane synthase|nr:hydroxymethylbilane synthase [Bacteroidales bacterium]